MAGGGIPYNLRINKTVERQIFTDLLFHLKAYLQIQDYTYISLGGPFLEDFKLLHNLFNLKDMISLEGNEYVYKRQVFNQPNSYIRLFHQRTTEFIENYDFQNRVMVWLDFTYPKQLGEQLLDFHNTIQKMPTGSIIKITVNAHISSLFEQNSLEPLVDGEGNIIVEKQYQREQRLKVRRCEEFKNLIDYNFHKLEYITDEYMTTNNYPSLLLETLKLVGFKALEGTNEVLIPLSSFAYEDGQKMLTFTGIKLAKHEQETFISHTNIDHWEYFFSGHPININVPILTFGEKIYIDKFTPNAHMKILSDPNFSLGEKESETEKLLENFNLFYRFYPSMSKIIL